LCPGERSNRILHVGVLVAEHQERGITRHHQSKSRARHVGQRQDAHWLRRSTAFARIRSRLMRATWRGGQDRQQARGAISTAFCTM